MSFLLSQIYKLSIKIQNTCFLANMATLDWQLLTKVLFLQLLLAYKQFHEFTVFCISQFVHEKCRVFSIFSHFLWSKCVQIYGRRRKNQNFSIQRCGNFTWSVEYSKTRFVSEANERASYKSLFDPRGRPQSTNFIRPYAHLSVRSSQTFKIKRKSLPSGTVDWLSGSLMSPVLSSDVFSTSPIRLFLKNVIHPHTKISESWTFEVRSGTKQLKIYVHYLYGFKAGQGDQKWLLSVKAFLSHWKSMSALWRAWFSRECHFLQKKSFLKKIGFERNG